MLLGWVALVGWGTTASAQQIAAGVTNSTLNDSYFERMGLSAGFRLRGGGLALRLPSFGRSPVIPGQSIGAGPFDSRYLLGMAGNDPLRPYAVGNVPLVGGFPLISAYEPPLLAEQAPVSLGNPAVQQALQQANAGQPLSTPKPSSDTAPTAGLLTADESVAERVLAAQNSSAGQAVPSVAEARRAYQAERAALEAETHDLVARGQAAEQAGKPVVAKVLYQQALRRAVGEQKADIQQRLQALQAPPVAADEPGVEF